MEGPTKMHVEYFMNQLGATHELVDEKEATIVEMLGHAREAADEIASLSQALEEEQTLRVNLEETLEGIEETNNILLSKLRKERDHALALVKVRKSEKVEFGDGHAKGHEEFENLDKAHKALESKFLTLSKSHDDLQIQLTKELTRVSLMPIDLIPCATTTCG